jgi:ATP/maltotriose-dependent transcriptional regulator MalT
MTDFKSSLTVAEEMDAVARDTNDVSRKAIADWMLGSSQYVLGNPAVSKELFERGFSHNSRATDVDQQLAGLYYRTRALYGLARVQWLCGFPDRALHSARQSMLEAADSGSPMNVSYSLVYSCYVFLWCGDLDTARQMNETVMAQPHWQGRLMWFHAEALALQGELLVRRGRLEEGIELLRATLADMQSTSQKNLMLSVTACCLAEALATTGRAEEALTVINDAIALAPGGAETWDAPELFRIKAIVLLSLPQPDETRAENCLMQSLALARHQGAIGWELRTTITLARLRTAQDRVTEARDMLSKVYDRFTEGFETQDLKVAAALLSELAAPAAVTSPSLSSASAPGSYRR